LITNVSKQRKKFNTAMLSSWYPAYVVLSPGAQGVLCAIRCPSFWLSWSW